MSDVPAPTAPGSSARPAESIRAKGLRTRNLRILWFALRTIARFWFWDIALPRLGLRRWSERRRAARLVRTAREFHGLAASLGGLMIKVGQFMSTRMDVLPAEITDELSGLQDKAPPVPFAQIRALAQESLGQTLEEAYDSFSEQPLAAASLGQAHRAVYRGQPVVVKVQRPAVEAVVGVDLGALRRVARWLSHVHLISKRTDLPALVEEFARTSLEEIDYVHEAANAKRFRAAFAGDARVGAPRVLEDRSTARVLTLTDVGTDVGAIKIGDVAALRAAGIDPHRVAETFADLMLDQFFAHRFFHADPHPGNLFVTPGTRPGGFTVTFIDFGMMGTVTPELRRAVRSFAIAVARRDGSGLVRALDAMNVLLPGADRAELTRAMTQLFSRFGGLSVSDMQGIDPREFEDFFAQFSDLARDLPFQLPEDFLLIVRAVSLVSGLCSRLNQKFNMWEAVEPYAGRLLAEEGGSWAVDAGKQVIDTVQTLVRLPGRIEFIIDKIDRGELSVKTPGVDRELRRLQGLALRAVGALLFCGLLIGGAVLFGTDPSGPARVGGVVLMIASVLPFGYALFGARRYRHRR